MFLTNIFARILGGRQQEKNEFFTETVYSASTFLWSVLSTFHDNKCPIRRNASAPLEIAAKTYIVSKACTDVIMNYFVCTYQ